MCKMVGHACATEARGTIRSESSPSCSESWQILSGPQVLAGDDIVWRSVEKLRESGKRKVSTGEEESLYFCRGAAVASGSKEKKRLSLYIGELSAMISAFTLHDCFLYYYYYILCVVGLRKMKN